MSASSSSCSGSGGGDRDGGSSGADGGSPAARLRAMLGARTLEFVRAAAPGSWRPAARDCVLVTCDEDPELGPDDWYLKQALTARGINPVPPAALAHRRAGS